MKPRVRIFLCLLAIAACTAIAQQQPLELVVPPAHTTSPNEIITLVFLATHRGAVTDTYHFSVDVPQGFQLVGPVPPLTLAPGAQEPVFMTLLVLSDTPAGNYSIGLEATSQSDPNIKATARVTVTVQAVTGVAVHPPDMQEVDPGTEVILSFTVTNRGNIIDAFRLEAATRRGFPTQVEPVALELLPGVSHLVLVSIKVPADAEPGFEPVMLTATSLMREGVQGSATASLILLPPSAARVPTELFLKAPAELSLSTSFALDSKILTQLLFRTTAIFPEEQRFSLKLRVSEEAQSQISYFSPINVSEFLFTAQRSAFFFHLGDLPRLPMLYNALPQRGIELGLSNLFSLLATFEAERQAFALSLFGAGLSASIARLINTNISNPYVLTMTGFRSSTIAVEGAIAEMGVGPQRMIYARAAPRWGALTAGFELLRVDPLFPTLVGVPAVLSDTQLWTVFGSIGIGPLVFSSLLSGKRTDLSNDLYFPAQAIHSRIMQARLIFRIFGLPGLSFDMKQVSKRSDDPGFPPLSTDEDTKLVTVADLSGPVSYILTFRHYLFTDNLNAAPDTSTIEFNGLLIARRLLGTEGLSFNLGIKQLLHTDRDTGAILEQQSVLTARFAFTAPRASASLWFGLNNHVLVGVGSKGFFGSLSFFFLGPPDLSLSLAFAEPSSLSANAEVLARFALPFESVFVKGRVEGFIFIDLNGNSMRDPNEPGVKEALLRLADQLARTDEKGFYRFPPVDPKAYSLELVRLPLGVVPTVAIPIHVTVAVGQVSSVDIPVRLVGIIQGQVFDDKNRNGKPDFGELGLAGVRVMTAGPTTAEARTSNDGRYILQVSPGIYTVSLDQTTLPKRYAPTTSPSVSVTVQTGQTAALDFGAAEVPRPVLFAPLAEFTFTPTQPRVGERVVFDASTSTDSDGQISLYEWDFDGDGKTDAVGRIVEHIFRVAGSFSVKLTVTDNDDLKNSITKAVSVRP